MNQQTLDSTNNVEKLATRCARNLAQVIRQEVARGQITLPLDEGDIQQLLDMTISDLREGGNFRRDKIAWLGISADRYPVFADAWTREMTNQGIRN